MSEQEQEQPQQQQLNEPSARAAAIENRRQARQRLTELDGLITEVLAWLDEARAARMVWEGEREAKSNLHYDYSHERELIRHRFNL